MKSARRKSPANLRKRLAIALAAALLCIVAFAAANTRLGLITLAQQSWKADSKGESLSVKTLTMTDAASFSPGVRCPPGNDAPCAALRKLAPRTWSIDVTSWSSTSADCGVPFVQSMRATAKGSLRIVTSDGGSGATTKIDDELDRTGTVYGLYSCASIDTMADAWATSVLALAKNLNPDRSAFSEPEAVSELGDGYLAGVVAGSNEIWAISGNDAPLHVPHTGGGENFSHGTRAASFLTPRNVMTLAFIQETRLLAWDFPTTDAQGETHVADPQAVCGIKDAAEIAPQSPTGICILHLGGRLTCAEDTAGKTNCDKLAGAGVQAPMTSGMQTVGKMAYADTCILDSKGTLLCRPWSANRGNVGNTFSAVPASTNIARVIGLWNKREICVEQSGTPVCFDLETLKMRPFSEVPTDATMPTIIDDAVFGARLFYLRGGTIQQAASGAVGPYGPLEIAPPPPESGGIESFRVYASQVLAISKRDRSLLYWSRSLPKSASMLSIGLYRNVGPVIGAVTPP